MFSYNFNAYTYQTWTEVLLLYNTHVYHFVRNFNNVNVKLRKCANIVDCLLLRCNVCGAEMSIKLTLSHKNIRQNNIYF